MTSRNLTEVFFLMRNNAVQNRNMYDDRRPSDSDRLLQRTLRDAEEGLELRDDYASPPIWLDKLEEAQYTISKIKPKLDELGSLHARHLLRPSLDDRCEEEELIENLSQTISKLISSTHRHIQFIRSSLGQGNKLEQRLTKNVVTHLLLSLQDVTYRFRTSQSNYLKQLNSREARSNAFFETPDFTTIDLNDGSAIASSSSNAHAVDTFDNFLKPTTSKPTANSDYFEQSDEQIDEYFQKSISQQGRMTQTQLLLFEEENTKMAEHREKEVIKIVSSIADLHDIFKDLAQMVQEAPFWIGSITMWSKRRLKSLKDIDNCRERKCINERIEKCIAS
ncbi:syntaxin-16 isoform X2 [Contarinia nasturtii]|uniref:syntaxin-16 isoform X2 n=1 Tax=Contarinia nasturtii TaxID=265458 RepID=UPI0012D4175E|nr:syntaxin-16 isoform X2 [Contarinia nasturtii]